MLYLFPAPPASRGAEAPDPDSPKDGGGGVEEPDPNAGVDGRAAPPRRGAPQRCRPSELLVDGGTLRIDIETPIATREDGLFEPIGLAIERRGALRDELAQEISIPSLRSYSRVRIALLGATVLPMAMLLELDRELIAGRNTSVGRVLIDLLLVAFVVFELSRRTPRMPKIAAIALCTIALRWGLIAARLCSPGDDSSGATATDATSRAHPLVYLGMLVPVVAALVLAVRVPSRSRVALELLDKIGISRSDLWKAKTRRTGEEPPGALIAAAIACAAGLPAVLHLTRTIGAGLPGQAIVFIGFGIVAPILVRRAMEAKATTSSSGSRSTARAVNANAISPADIMMGTVVGLALTAAVVTAGRLFFDVGAELARCVDRLDAEARFARGAEAAELANAVAKVRASMPLVVMTAAVFPFAEERIYRGLLQDVLTRKYGASYGVFAASLAFGVAHLGIYQVALYQTVLLGIGFGVAYVEGGLLAAFFVHATWNLLQLT